MLIMNRTLSTLVLATLLVLSQPTRAQVGIGLRGGLNIASFSISSPDSHWDGLSRSSYLGPSIGAIVQLRLSEWCFIRCEPGYVQKGTSYTLNSYFLQDDTKRTLKMDFVNLPVLIGLQIPGKQFSPYVFVGPNLGFTLTDGYNSIDVAVDAGVGVFYRVSSGVSLFLDVRYSLGVSNLNSASPGEPEIQTRAILPSCGAFIEL